MQEPNKTFPNGVVIIRAKNEQIIGTIIDVVLRQFFLIKHNEIKKS